MKGKSLILSAVAFALIQGCSSESTNSDNVKTEGIWAGISVLNEGSFNNINVEFNVGGRNGTNLILTGNDQVTASLGDTTIVLSKDDDFFDVDYEGAIPNSEQNNQFIIALNRPNDTSAPNSRVTMPRPFSIIYPGEDMVFTQLADIGVYWDVNRQQVRQQKSSVVANDSPAVPQMELFQSASCKTSADETVSFSLTETVDDSGRYTSSFLSTIEGVDWSKGCDLTFSLERKEFGDLDSAYQQGGFIRAIQKRTVKFRVEL